MAFQALLRAALDRGGRDVEVDQEVGVRTVCPVVRLAGGQGKGLLDQAEVQVQQEGAVEEQEAPAAALGVAGELEAANGEVGLAPPFDGGAEQRGQRVAVALEDELVGGGDAVAAGRSRRCAGSASS